MSDKPIYVTQPFLPPLEEFSTYLEQIWKSKVLTNGGPFHQQLEKALCEYLGVDHIALFSNGTLALVTALQSLRITGVEWHQACLCRHRSTHAQSRPAPDRGRDHAADHRHHAGALLWPPL